MGYQFDEIIDRRGSDSENVEGWRKALFRGEEALEFPVPEDELIRMWVADMEFAVPDVILDAIRARVDRRILGYSNIFDAEYYELFAAWTERRYGWKCRREELVTSSGVVPALYELVDYITAADERVLIMTPSYAPFQKAAAYHGRSCVYSHLKKTGSRYEIDFADLEAKCEDPKLTLCIFCNPHNPTGRLWTEAELRRFGACMERRGIWVISDEIHCDLLRSGKRHIPLAKLIPDYKRIVTCMAPSKSFNIAGLQHSQLVIPDEGLRKTWKMRHLGGENPLSLAACRAAYEKGEPWLEALLRYVDGNQELVKSVLQAQLPEALFEIPEAGYLAWIDFGAYFPAGAKLARFFAEKAGVLLEDERMFVANAEGCVRLNLAMPRAQLAKTMDQICRAVKELCP